MGRHLLKLGWKDGFNLFRFNKQIPRIFLVPRLHEHNAFASPYCAHQILTLGQMLFALEYACVCALHCAAQAAPALTILLPQTRKCQDFEHALLHPTLICAFHKKGERI